jgi:Mrp family chromosome partitioning ATPase
VGRLHFSLPRAAYGNYPLVSRPTVIAIVVHSGYTPRKLVKKPRANLRNIPVRMIGVVLNQVDLSGEDYAYGYSDNAEDSEENSRACRATA